MKRGVGGWRLDSGPTGRAHQFPSPSLSPVGSSLLGREPAAESFSHYEGRVIRIPSAAKPLLVSLLPWEGGGCEADGG